MLGRSLTLGVFALTGCFGEPPPSETAGSSGDSADATLGSTAESSGTAADGGPSSATSAGDADGTGTDSGDTGMPPPECGDGVLDPGEECDDGRRNQPHAPCTPLCTTARCGDGFLAATEACDDGDRTGLMVGTCRFDCQGVAPTRQITVSAGSTQGNFTIDSADGACSAAGRAIVAIPGVRVASVTPLLGDGQLEWVLAPHTAYTNTAGELVWVTDDVALLGVRDGKLHSLLAPLGPDQGGVLQAWTGLTPGWEVDDATCAGWTGSGQGRLGLFATADPSAWSSPSSANCSDQHKFYCVEQ